MNRVDTILNHVSAPTQEFGDLSGKCAVITGAASGIGRATAVLFAQQNAKAVLLADVNEKMLRETEALVREVGSDTKVMCMKVDVSQADQVKAMVDACVANFGDLHIMVANAGIVGTPRLVQFTDVKEFQRVFSVNVVGVFLCIKHASLAMEAQQHGGSIVCTASVAGLRSGAGPSPYSASKAAVVNLVQTSSWQLTGKGIRVNAVCPGLVETGMTKFVFETARKRGKAHKIGQLNPSKRSGNADEIANAILFLACDQSSYVNGQALPVCGGLSASHPVVPGKVM